ncbi:MAG: hypothetical protein H8Z69_05925 [Nanohaloarchaea archaeon]|nr:hypothetical protein [Candidatus Nanohaloarchaea archaeon]
MADTLYKLEGLKDGDSIRLEDAAIVLDYRGNYKTESGLYWNDLRLVKNDFEASELVEALESDLSVKESELGLREINDYG